MTILLWACLNPDCCTAYYRTVDGRCPGCGGEGHQVGWALKPPRARKPPDDNVE